MGRRKNKLPRHEQIALDNQGASIGRREIAIVLLSLIIFVLLLTLTFFTERTIHNGITTVAFQNWVGVLFVACVVGLTFACFSIRDKNFRFGWAGTIFSLLGLVLLGPTFFTDHIRTDGKQFVSQAGLSFNREIHKFNFEDIIEIDLTQERTSRGHRRGTRSTDYALMHLKDSSEVKLSLDSILMVKGGSDILFEQAKARNIPINDLRKE